MSWRPKWKQAKEPLQAPQPVEKGPESPPPAPDPEPATEQASRPSRDQQRADATALTPPAVEHQAVAPPKDDELPPPPADIVETAKKLPPMKSRKPATGAALKRAGTIFGKDVRTIARHGLVGSIILLVFLMVVFSIASYAMVQLVSSGFGLVVNGHNGTSPSGGAPHLGNDGSLVAHAGQNRTVLAGSLVTLDSSGTRHTADIAYVQWTVMNQNSSGWRSSPSVYGPIAQYTFHEVGKFAVHLIIIDTRWNLAEANLTVTVIPSTSDTTPPVPVVTGTNPNNVTYGQSIRLDASNSTDNVGVVNWTWEIHDVIDRTRYGPTLGYTFETAGNKQITLVVRDVSGNIAIEGQSINVTPSDPTDNSWPNARMNNLPRTVMIGDTVRLDASQSSDNRMIVGYEWYVQLNNTMTRLMGQTTSFVASSFGDYQITLVVMDSAGNAGTAQNSVIALTQGMKAPSAVSWTSTPLGQKVPFDVLTFVYGASLLASVIYLGGLFSKGFAHEVQRGTAKTLFAAPLSVTNLVFAKLLYPLLIGPLFIFPLLLVSLSPLQQDPTQILEIGAVSYVFTALVLVSGVYGSCMIYAATKRMSVKPTVVAKSFMYLSLIGTLSVFAGCAFLLDRWFSTDSWNKLYENLGPKVAMFSPFHQGGLAIRSLLFGAPLSLDWIVFAIPLALIVGGVLASRRLYADIFSRE